MDEFDDWLRECYREKEITDEEIISAISDYSARISLWNAFIDSFTHDDKQAIVLHALKRFRGIIDIPPLSTYEDKK